MSNEWLYRALAKALNEKKGKTVWDLFNSDLIFPAQELNKGEADTGGEAS